MEPLKKVSWESILTSAVWVVLGGVLIFFPKAVNEMIAYVLAAAMFIVAVIEFYNYFKKDLALHFYRNDLVFGVVALVVGIILLAKKDVVISLVPVALGAMITISGVKKLQNGLDILRLKMDGWKPLLILAAINIIFGVIMIICALQAATVITILIGVGLVYSGGTDLFSSIWVSKKAKKASKDKPTEETGLTELPPADPAPTEDEQK